ncbi:helix-turn-helix transcriptional regulator [Pseudalkalibacillus caeni]|nr:helix-turn-helix transcriptional regulator [Pseudalkalibacillus caeni]
MKPRIKELMDAKGLKQKWVAEQMGVSQQLISDWSNGRVYPRIDKAYKLCTIIGCRIEELYEED